MSARQMHWIITFTEARPGETMIHTADGLMDRSAHPSRQAAFQAIKAAMTAHLGISEAAVVTFFALEPNDLASIYTEEPEL